MNLVYTEDYGIPGINYYWVRNEMYHLTHDELRSVGVVDGRSQVSDEIIEPLKRADTALREQGYSLMVKDGYRSPELYRLVYEKRVDQFGKEATDRILNVVTMPHASGKVVDVALLNLADGKEVMLRNKEDGVDAFFIDFYRKKDDAQSEEYQGLQDLLLKTMTDQGFKLGRKNEYWHFEMR